VDGKPSKHVFVFTPSVGVEHFWVDLDGRHVFVPTPKGRGSAYVGSVYVIFILRV
jgi:hypothetical protein